MGRSKDYLEQLKIISDLLILLGCNSNHNQSKSLIQEGLNKLLPISMEYLLGYLLDKCLLEYYIIVNPTNKENAHAKNKFCQ